MTAAVLSGLHYLVAQHLETGEDPPDYVRSIWKAYLGWLDEAPEHAERDAPLNRQYRVIEDFAERVMSRL